jgi:succinate dehydrogenase / fumarate reductase iron-sulfur subunit
MEIIKDLIVDMQPFWGAYQRIEPWLHVNGEPKLEKERLQSPQDVKKLDPYINCILCACCYGSCPVLGHEDKYLGPAAIAKLFRFMRDSRDQRGAQFLKRVDNQRGLWACHTIFRCVDACPKDIRPTDTIEALRRELVVYRFKKFFRLL